MYDLELDFNTQYFLTQIRIFFHFYFPIHHDSSYLLNFLSVKFSIQRFVGIFFHFYFPIHHDSSYLLNFSSIKFSIQRFVGTITKNNHKL